jgi:hypothetical protein
VERLVYLLCVATALACSLLLLRGYLRSKVRLLLWCGIFFLALALENVGLFLDLVVLPNVDLSGVRTTVALVGTLLLLYGLIWDAK